MADGQGEDGRETEVKCAGMMSGAKPDSGGGRHRPEFVAVGEGVVVGVVRAVVCCWVGWDAEGRTKSFLVSMGDSGGGEAKTGDV